MESIRVAAVSMNSELGQQEATMGNVARFCEQAAEERAELVLFPELLIHGHCTPDTWKIAEPVPGSSTGQLVKLAQKHQLFLCVGLSEKENDIVYNTQVLVGPEGFIGSQRKLHMSRDESFHYKGGRTIQVFDLGKCRVGIVICYDNQFPEVGRIVALKGADIILMPHAAREGRWDEDADSQAKARRKVFDYFSSSYRMRARENACFCVYADQAGKAGYVDSLPRDHMNQPHHPGGAMAIDPFGRIIEHTQLDEIRDEMLVADLDAQLLAKARSHPNYTLRTRRPELFDELVAEQVSR